MKKRILSIITALTILTTSNILNESKNNKNNNDLQESSITMYLDESEDASHEEKLDESIPEFYKKQLKECDILLTKQLVLDMNNEDDFSWISKCENLEYLELNIVEDIDVEKLSCLSNLNNLNILDIRFAYQLDYKELINIILNSNIKEFYIGFERRVFYPDDIDFINEILDSKKLDCFFFGDAFSCSVDFKENVFKIYYHYKDFSTLRIPYGYENKLFNKGMDVCVYNYGHVSDYLFYYNEVNKDYPVKFWTESQNEEFQELMAKLKDIFDKLDIEKNDLDKEKIKKILYYIVENYTYDFEAYFNKECEKYYDGGRIVRPLNDRKIICGNYSAIFQALANLAGLESYVVDGQVMPFSSEYHSWNVVKIDDKYYLIDPTWIDKVYDFLNCESIDLVDEEFLLEIANLINQDKYFLDMHLIPEDFKIDIENNLSVISPCLYLFIYASFLDMLKTYKNLHESNANKLVLQKKKQYSK